MPRQAQLAAHLSPEELKQKYEHGEDQVERRRYHLLWLVSQQWTIKKASEAVGISYEYGQQIFRAYNEEGVRGIRHRRRDITPPGNPSYSTKHSKKS